MTVSHDSSISLGFKTLPAEVADKLQTPATSAGKVTGNVKVVADYTQAGQTRWMTDGQAFGQRPMQTGEIALSGDAGRPISRVFSRGCAARDEFWSGLSISSDNESSQTYLVPEQRSGRMIRTPTITLEHGKLYYLIRGRTKVYAAVDSHICIRPHLHARLMTSFDTSASEQPVWCEHDLTPYVGRRVHVEFGPVDDSNLEVLMVVDADRKPEPVVDDQRNLLQAITDKSVDSVEKLARAYQEIMLDVAQRLGSGRLQNDPDAAQYAPLADWLVQHHDLVVPPASDARSQLAKAVAQPMQRRADLQNSLRLESHTALSWMDCSGVDERRLVRGSYQNPAEVVPRRLSAAFSDSRPIESSGSGRLELARQLVEPANPLLARVFVNRVWQHLFGRGIVATVDNFGYVGQCLSLANVPCCLLCNSASSRLT